MKRYKGLGRVLSFTLTQQLRQRGWRAAPIAVALACLLSPSVSLSAAAQHQINAAPDQNVTVWESYDQDVLDSAGLTSRQQELLTVRVDVSVTGGRSGEGQAADVLSMVLPFVSLMLLYFLVLLYGQGTAASVLLEKTSKLMDLFLVSVEPTAMVLGKVLATALAGLLQLAVWILSLMGGFAAGGALAAISNTSVRTWDTIRARQMPSEARGSTSSRSTSVTQELIPCSAALKLAWLS